LPLLLILMTVIFGSLAAAGLPLVIGVFGILGSFTALRLLTLFTGVSVFSLNITTILGLGLGIDYGLFLVSRFREELHRRDSVEDAVARTLATAGRTVLVSGITVAIVLSSLMLFPETILRSMGYGGVATVLVDMLAALTVLPALLAVLGPKVNALAIRRSIRRPPATDGGRWYRLAHSVMRPPSAVRRPDRGAAARARLTVPEGRLGRDRRHGAVGRRSAPGGDRSAEPGLPGQPDRPDRNRRPVPRPGDGLGGPHQRAGRVREPPGPRTRSQRRPADRRPRGHRAGEPEL